MKLSIIEVGRVPERIADRFVSFPRKFMAMFEASGLPFAFETVNVLDGQELPDPSSLEGVVITGSPAGVYEDHAWLDPLRAFIREAYAAQTPMVGICFGHQIMADALGGTVQKSDKGWGLGRHSYNVVGRPGFMRDAPPTLAIACSHQDQVIVPPAEAEVILASDFAPHAGLFYRSGKALSFQPHPEFSDGFAMALAEMRRDSVSEAQLDKALASFANRSDSALLRDYIARFLYQAAKPR
ncbi:gamma-glutamyl-gamma-aminobutyrate hydrolase family protein [Devosia sp. YIM 151766]|uniref:type 1 glutamine amidotransferase n=1 Tax=Devosia sp. YIM 151766 TaxID=3017325 RepID=UPI00255CA01E|nr:gamma-glutamyl-gamma-aminobutyrate hydrolase family protein [Devosia sp. YIM 151766]WIY52180.1 gamma-glutamyl-gamma-aminobutyrate hydrolase family protein [Devosia sp. YIM 151766]